MDIKGITWVGNIYEKLEAMCLEADEVMYQDAVRYVENQVQSVGDTVKKFYSDVMQDFLPPSLVDPIKDEVPDLPADRCHGGIHVKPKLSMKENSANSAESSVAGSKLNGQFHVDYLFSVSQPDNTAGLSRRFNEGTVTEKSNLGAYKSLKREGFSSTESSEATLSLDNDLKQASSISDSNNPGVSVNQISTVSNSESVKLPEHDCQEENEPETKNASVKVSDTLTSEPSYDKDNSVESGADGELSARLSPVTGSSTTSNDDCVTNEVPSPPKFCSSVDEWSSAFADEDNSISNSGMSNECIMVVDNDNVLTGHETDALQQTDKQRLDETFVLVSGEEFQFAPCNEDNSKSYKKKIQNIFYSKKKSMRKKEYEQLAICLENNLISGQEDYAKSSGAAMKEEKKSSSLELCESEWELL